MAKRTRVSDQEREAIVAAFDTGKSCNEIAREFDRASGTISRIAKSVGHEFAQSNADHARELKAKYDDERRQQIRLSTVDNAERVLAQLFEATVVFNFGGRDNTYTERKVAKPTYRDQRDIAQTFKTLMSVVLEIDKREIADHDAGLFDALFDQIRAEADGYDPHVDSEAETGVVDSGG